MQSEARVHARLTTPDARTARPEPPSPDSRAVHLARASCTRPLPPGSFSLRVCSRAVIALTRVPDGELEFGASEGEHFHFEIDSHRVSHVALEVARGEAQQDRRLADATVADLRAE